MHSRCFVEAVGGAEEEEAQIQVARIRLYKMITLYSYARRVSKIHPRETANTTPQDAALCIEIL